MYFCDRNNNNNNNNKDMKDIDSENAGIRDGDIDDSDEGTGGASRTEAGTREARTRNVYQR